METPNIDLISLALCLLLVIIPLGVSLFLDLGIVRTTLVAVVRMMVQLSLVGIFLKYIFALDNLLVTVAWLLMMVSFAAATVIRDTAIGFRHFIVPILLSLLAATFFVLFYFDLMLLDDAPFLTASYAIAIGGMLLGNSLKGSIIGIRSFFEVLRRQQPEFRYHLALGATRYEALRPHIRDALRTALLPTLATMSTLGIVFLPGMMTGQILGGTGPLLAIKYQIAIMIAIFVCTTTCVGLAILFSVHVAFDRFGMLRRGVFPAGD